MKRHYQYFKYIMKHKWFVFVAGIKIGTPIWRLIIHDISKFRPREWGPYSNFFYGGPHSSYSDLLPALKYNYDCYRSSKEGVKEAFDIAWLHHQHDNPHHWQYWLLKNDSGRIKRIPIPYNYMLEMIADWAGAGRAIVGKWEISEWYNKNKKNIMLHPETKKDIERIINANFKSKKVEDGNL